MKKSLVAAVAMGLLCSVITCGPATAQYFQVPAPYPNQYPPPAFGNTMPSVIYGQRCQFMAGVCLMGASGPVGSPCYCITPYGAAPGMIVQ